MATITPAVTYPVNSGGFNTPGGQVAYAGTAYSGTFIPSLWSGKMAQKFYATTVFGEIANTDWQGEIHAMGDRVIINTIPSITINAYEIGMNLQYEVPAPSTVSLTIDKGKYFGVNVNDVLEYQAKPKLMDMFTNDASQQMKIKIDKDLLYTNFNQGAAANMGADAGLVGSYDMGTDEAPVTLTGANILQKIVEMSTILDEQNVPEDGRYLVISPYERQLLMQSNLAQAQFMGDSTSMVRNGRIGTIDRFTVYVSNQLPTGAVDKTWLNPNTGTDSADVGNAKRHAVIAGHKSAITFASQITKVETLQNPNDFGQLVRGLNVYGSKVVTGEALTMMVVAG